MVAEQKIIEVEFFDGDPRLENYLNADKTGFANISIGSRYLLAKPVFLGLKKSSSFSKECRNWCRQSLKNIPQLEKIRFGEKLISASDENVIFFCVTYIVKFKSEEDMLLFKLRWL